ncbi:MAG: NADH-quinone oxidoreductase subunit L [Phycisphaeraceae bacterium]|jgi:NADH-quinone oxidoreductase subunit L|nr:NADH-quinone oxidoreductase subunit L [Phycisphaeraceae bacterium]
MNIELVKWIPWLPALGAVVCAGVAFAPRRVRWIAAPVCVLSILIGFLITCGIAGGIGYEDGTHQTVTVFQWIHAGTFHADMAYFIDPLTVLMLMVVTGVGTLVAWYACGYMKGDPGYARFFAAVGLFIFAMATLVMADNLVLMYLGWEGVGLCSYLLIGFYYDKPSAVAAAKKAFIVNRVGDLGFAIGIFWTFTTYDTMRIPEIIAAAQAGGVPGADTANIWIPFLFMLGAFGKSAQLPLHVWLPDAMEGPTPVSALIHAATMVTAGVYMIARLSAVFALSPAALPTIAVVGALTAIMAATIAVAQYDIKRVFAYSTISQLGYMFLGLGVLSTYGAVFHLFTHAFFKALLFLTAGSVMHALVGQLDMRNMSGLRHKMPWTCWLMFVGCLALAGVPFFSGFFSKDVIIVAALDMGLMTGPQGQLEAATVTGRLFGPGTLYTTLAVVSIITAFITVFYTFRLWFRVFWGPEEYFTGDEHDVALDHLELHDTDDRDVKHITISHHHEPHEMPFWLMNAPLCVLAVGAVAAGWSFIGGDWVEQMVHGRAGASHGEHAEHAMIMGMSTHTFMMIVGPVLAVAGIWIAAVYHLWDRPSGTRRAMQYRHVAFLLHDKYYIDELYDRAIVRPLRALAHVFDALDRMLVNGLIVQLIGTVPGMIGRAVRPTQRGVLQDYGLAMLTGIAVIAVLLIMAKW